MISKQRSSENRSIWLGCFALLTALALIPIWLFPYVPTQDGPAHLDAAATLLELSRGSALFGTFFEAQWQLGTNQLYHALLVLLGSAMPLLLAEKLLLSLYVLCMPLAVLFALRGLRGANRSAVFLVFPAICPFVFYLGFYNFCAGLVFFSFTLGVYLRLARAEAPGQRVALTAALALSFALCYAAHIISAANALLVLGVMASVALLNRRPNAGLSALLVVAAALPTVLFVLTFFLRQPVREDGTTQFLSVGDLVAAFFVQVPDLPYKLYSSLVVHTWLDALFLAPWHLLLVGLAGLAIYGCMEGRRVPHPELLAALGLVLFITLWTPNRLGEIGFLTDRFLPYTYVLLTLWLSTVAFSPHIWRVAAVAGVVCAAALLLYRIPVHAALNVNVREFASAHVAAEREGTVLPLILVKDNNAYPPPGLVLPNMRYSEMLHAVGYIALLRPVVTLNDYQAAKGYFPLRYEAAKSPITHLSEDGLRGLERPPFAFDIGAYRDRTGAEVDYVFLWGDLEEVEGRSDVQAILAQLEAYDLIYTSAQRSLMRVYARDALNLGAERSESRP